MKNIFEKLKNYKNFMNANFTVVFVLCVIMLGGLSLYKFADFIIYKRVDYNEWNADLGNKAEAKLSTSFFQKFNFINLNGLVRKVLKQREMNGVVKLNNGHLLTTISYTEDKKLEAYAEKILQAKNFLAESGIEFIYAITPYTSCKFDPQLPVGIEDYGNDDLDRLCGFLREKGIEPVDFRQEFYDDGIDHYKMMYRTDHHWNIHAGFYAFSKLNGMIEQKLGVQVDERVKDFSNYDVAKYAKWQLGSRGARTGVLFERSDDVDLLSPKFETEIEKFTSDESFYKKEGGTVGTFESEVMDLSIMEKKVTETQYRDILVYGYNGGNKYFTNKKDVVDKRILLVSDSQGANILPFLILAYKDFHIIWHKFDYAQIDKYKPDVVILLDYAQNAAYCAKEFILP